MAGAAAPEPQESGRREGTARSFCDTVVTPREDVFLWAPAEVRPRDGEGDGRTPANSWATKMDDLSADLASLRIDRSAPREPRSWPRWIAWLGALGALGAASMALAPYAEAQLFKTAVSTTEVTRVSPVQATVELTATGYVQAELVSRVAPKVPGRVLAVHVQQGDRVESGQKLLDLDPADDQASIRAARSEVTAASAQAESAKARADVARSQLTEAEQKAARERLLAERGATGRAVAEDLEAKVDSLTQSLRAAEAEARAARANTQALGSRVSVLETGLSNLRLEAPITGTILNKPPQIGEYVGPQPPGVTVDMGGIRIADLSSLVVETDIPEAKLSQVRPGVPVEIVLDAFPSRRFRGTVKQITPLVDRAKATVMVKVAFSDPVDGVLPDMAARVSLLSKPIDAATLAQPSKLVVPSSAVAKRAGTSVVFMVEEGKVRMIPVELGERSGAGFELLRGPREGARLVANPPAELGDGQPVKLDG